MNEVQNALFVGVDSDNVDHGGGFRVSLSILSTQKKGAPLTEPPNAFTNQRLAIRQPSFRKEY